MIMLTGNQFLKARLLANRGCHYYKMLLLKARLLYLQARMRLEASEEQAMYRGRSAMATVKAEFGFKGNRAKIQEQLQVVIDSMSDTPIIEISNKGG